MHRQATFFNYLSNFIQRFMELGTGGGKGGQQESILEGEVSRVSLTQNEDP